MSKEDFIAISKEKRSLTLWADQSERTEGGGWVYINRKQMSPTYDYPTTTRVWLTNFQIHELSRLIGSFINAVTDKR